MVNTNSLAADLLAALDGRAELDPPSARNRGFDLAAAFDVSAEIVRRRCARGERPIGRKIGFTNRLIWDEYGVSGPMWAHVYDSTVTCLDVPKGRLSIRHLVQPRIEPEIVLHFATAPTEHDDEPTLLASVDWIAHGFEIVQCHFPDWKFQLADTAADFGLHGALMVGPPQPIRVFEDVAQQLRSFTVALARDGQLMAQGAGVNVLGSPAAAAAYLIQVLRQQPRFAPIGAGEIVTTGTLTPAFPIRAGETWSTEVSGLPVPGLSVKFE